MNKFPNLSKDNLVTWLLGLIFFTAAFSVKKVFITDFSYSTGTYSDFLTYFFYLSDFLIVGLVAYVFFSHWEKLKNKLSFWLPMMLLVASLILNVTHLIPFNIFSFWKIIEFYFFAWAVSLAWDRRYRKLLAFFIIFGLFEAIIAIFQFTLQHSLGLKLLGESYLIPSLAGVAKIVFHGKQLIRPYGTFPHPNPLSAFIGLALFIGIFFRTTLNKSIFRHITDLWLILGSFCLLLTMSRAGIVAFGLSLLGYLGFLIYKKALTRRSFLPLAIIFISLAVSFLALKPFLLTRETISGEATDLRVLYNQTALKMLKSKPFSGLGPGTSMLHMEQFAPRPLQTWEIQPIHNFYLLTLAELGLVGGLALLFAIFWPAIKFFQRLIKKSAQADENFYYRAALISIFISMALLMLLDHYFYTLQQTHILLWLIVGLIMADLRQTA